MNSFIVGAVVDTLGKVVRRIVVNRIIVRISEILRFKAPSHIF
jgi:hypothetical protein